MYGTLNRVYRVRGGSPSNNFLGMHGIYCDKEWGCLLTIILTDLKPFANAFEFWSQNFFVLYFYLLQFLSQQPLMSLPAKF